MYQSIKLVRDATNSFYKAEDMQMVRELNTGPKRYSALSVYYRHRALAPFRFGPVFTDCCGGVHGFFHV
jgi:hypothetical protein